MPAYKKCLVGDCENDGAKPGSGRGWCSRHYQRFKRHGDPEAGGATHVAGGAFCGIEGCGKKSGGKGLCPMHRARLKSHGDTETVRKDRKRIGWIEDNRSYRMDDCLKWPFSTSQHGRGTVLFRGKNTSAPRAMCILAHGEPPTPKYQAAHSCGNGHEGCMNPRHLSWKTPKDNERDKVAHGTIRRGDKINTSKLCEDDVRAIRRDFPHAGGPRLAEKYGVSNCSIHNIYKRKSWAWLED